MELEKSTDIKEESVDFAELGFEQKAGDEVSKEKIKRFWLNASIAIFAFGFFITFNAARDYFSPVEMECVTVHSEITENIGGFAYVPVSDVYFTGMSRSVRNRRGSGSTRYYLYIVNIDNINFLLTSSVGKNRFMERTSELEMYFPVQIVSFDEDYRAWTIIAGEYEYLIDFMLSHMIFNFNASLQVNFRHTHDPTEGLYLGIGILGLSIPAFIIYLRIRKKEKTNNSQSKGIQNYNGFDDYNGFGNSN